MWKEGMGDGPCRGMYSLCRVRRVFWSGRSRGYRNRVSRGFQSVFMKDEDEGDEGDDEREGLAMT